MLAGERNRGNIMPKGLQRGNREAKKPKKNQDSKALHTATVQAPPSAAPVIANPRRKLHEQ
jgi:hypothetical protein